MTRHYFESLEPVEYSRRLSRPHLSRENVRSFPMAHHPPSPTHDSEDDKAENPPRRRIALACSRCRKRKIKCSGDSSSGQGCLNCKNAGMDPGSCQFLRVNSTSTLYSPSVSWPYSTSDSIIPTPAMPRVGSNTVHYAAPNGTLVSSSGPGYSSNPAQFSRQTTLNSLTGVSYHSRQPYPSNYGPSFGDDIFDSYPMPVSQYLLQDSQTSTGGYIGSESSRNWTPIPHINHKVPHGSSTFDQESSLRCAIAPYSYLNSSGSSISSVAADGSTAFPGMGSLATSLPAHSANVNRTLPNPTSKKPLRSSVNYVSQGELNESSTAGGVPGNIHYRPGGSWDSEHISAGGNQESISATSITHTGATERTNCKPSASPRRSHDPNNFAFIPSSQVPLATNTQLPDFLPEPAIPADSQHGLPATTFSTGLSSDPMLSSQGSSLYSYSMGSGTRNSSITNPSCSEGTLVSGLTYTQLPQLHSQLSVPFEVSRKVSFEDSHTTHRTSSVSSSSAGRY